jgi:hypothetical protein
MASDTPADPARPEAARPEMDDEPPFSTWRRIYFVVLGALAAQVVLYAALTAAFR